MSVRRAEQSDLATITTLWREFQEEIPPPQYEYADEDMEIREIAEILDSEIAFVAEDGDGGVVGFALGRRSSPTWGRLTDLYVRPSARRVGFARKLAHAVVADFVATGIQNVTLEVQTSNAVARAVYARWGLRDDVVVMTGSASQLQDRLADAETASFGSIHVQSDDLSAIEQAVRQFVPRLPGASQGSIVAPPRNGWIAVYDDVCDRDPAMLRRLGRELADRRGAVVVVLGVEHETVLRMILFERGSIVDEYLSVPEFHGPLPPGDVVGLAANPRVVSRLTGADPDAVRRVARTAQTPAELPPARELLAALADVFGIQGAEHGYADAPEIEGAVRVARS